MVRFVLIDGNAIIHRAFHALPPLTNPDGQLVNAVFGFFSMFLKILSDLKPTHIAVCFDRAAPTFRQTLYVGYQATRPKTADELISQIAMVHEILEKIGIQIFEVDGYEADDLIGTIAFQVVKSAKLKVKSLQEIEVVIVSGDRDFLQLINAHVKVYAPVVGLTNTVMFDAAKVEEKYGVKPSQIIDYKALVGDASDNYPGVSGIGPKTAGELLRKYGTFENLYKHIDELAEKIAMRLATDAEQASLAKKLATIDCHVPISLDREKCTMKQFDYTKVAQILDSYGFHSLAKRLKGETNSGFGERENKKLQKENTKQLGLL